MDNTPSNTSVLLDSLEAGDTMRDADAALAEVVRAVENTGLKGSLTIKIDFERKKPGVVLIVPTVTPKVPKEKANTCVRYLLRAWVVTCRLRYRVKADGVVFMLVPVRLDDLLDEIWNEIVALAKTWGPTVIEGTPV